MKILCVMYFKYRFYYRYGYFRKNMIYLLYVVVNMDLMLLKLEIYVNMRIIKSIYNFEFVIVFDVKNL